MSKAEKMLRLEVLELYAETSDESLLDALEEYQINDKEDLAIEWDVHHFEVGVDFGRAKYITL